MMIDYLILVKLLLAHFLADFCLQPKRFVQKKREGKQCYHFIHALIHAILAYLLVGCVTNWSTPLVIFGSHYLIDLWKSKRKESFNHFMIDQMLHLVTIIVLWLFMTDQAGVVWENAMKLFADQQFWVYLVGLVFILKPTSIILSLSTKRWEIGRGSNGLENAGKWIGYLERVLRFNIYVYFYI